MNMTREEMIEAYKVARESLVRGARQSFPDFASLRQPMDQQPALHHMVICHALDALEKGEIKGNRLMLMLPPGSAKALTLDTPVPTPSGWSAMGALAIGDEVFDERGQVCRVTWKSPVWKDRPIYTVQTDCGDVIRADKDHEWLVRLCGKHKVFKIKETWKLARKRSKRPMIERAGALGLPDADLPIDPYVLGQWLGNGHSGQCVVTSHQDDIEWVRAEFLRLGVETSDRSAPLSYGILGQRGRFVELGLLNDPFHNTHGRKHVPQIYMRASYAQRLSLVQGLVDSDGSVCKRRGCATFSNTNLELALQFRELVGSLGVKAGWSESRAMLNGKDCGPAYRVSFYLDVAARIPRKASLCRNQDRTPNTYIDVAPAGYADTVCIEVDSPSHLFLCGKSMTPTHNSTYGSKLFPQYFLGRNPQLSAILASHTTSLADGWGRKIRNGMQDPEFGEIFPGIGVAGDNASAGSWATNKGGEFFAAGVGTAIAGKRADLGIIDDPIGSREDADSERIRQKIWDWYISDFSTRLKPGAKQVLIQTRWHEADLAGMLLEREAAKWKVIKIPMIAGPDDLLGREEGERLWKEWFTDEMMETAQKDPRSWISLYQQEPRPAEGAEFKRTWLNRYASPPKIMNKILLVDPAGDPSKAKGNRKKSDFTAMWVLGLGSDQNIYLIDGLRDRLNLTQRADAVFAFHKKHKPMQTRYEQYGLQADVEHIKDQMEKRQYRFSIKEVGGNIEKNARIRRLIPYFEGGRIWLPVEMKRENVQGVTYDPVVDFVEHEYATFPVGKNDDSLDCLARLAEPSLTLPWPDEDEANDPKMQATWGTLDEITGY
jgi:phage terminase large subunit-like protein